MTNSVSQENSMFSGLGMSLGMSAVMTGGFGALSAAKRNGGVIKGGMKAINDARTMNPQNIPTKGSIVKNFTVNNKDLQNLDVFTKSTITAQNYDAFTQAQKNLAKYSKLVDKNGGKSPFQKIRSVFTRKDYAASNLANKTAAEQSLKTIKDNLNNGKAATDAIQGQLDNFAKAAQKGKLSSLKANSASILKTELKDPIGIAITGITVLSSFTSEAIPAFKNEGFAAGLKATGRAIAQGATNFVADAAFSTVFRQVGAAIGSVVGPVGTAVGSMIGNTIGAFVSGKIVQKIFPPKENTTIADAQNTQQYAPQQTQYQNQNTVQQQAQYQNQYANQQAQTFDFDAAAKRIEQKKQEFKANALAERGYGGKIGYYA